VGREAVAVNNCVRQMMSELMWKPENQPIACPVKGRAGRRRAEWFSLVCKEALSPGRQCCGHLELIAAVATISSRGQISVISTRPDFASQGSES
jgi:hypothetical protein